MEQKESSVLVMRETSIKDRKFPNINICLQETKMKANKQIIFCIWQLNRKAVGPRSV